MPELSCVPGFRQDFSLSWFNVEKFCLLQWCGGVKWVKRVALVEVTGMSLPSKYRRFVCAYVETMATHLPILLLLPTLNSMFVPF